MGIDFSFQMLYRRLIARFKIETVERHWDKARAILWRKKGMSEVEIAETLREKGQPSLWAA